MNKKIIALLSLALILTAFSGLLNTASAAAWTHLIFLDDPTGQAGREIDKFESYGGDSRMNIVAMWRNKAAMESTVYLIKKDGDPRAISSPVLEHFKITPSSDPCEELKKFTVSYSEKYPSDFIMITIYDRESIIINKNMAIFDAAGYIKKLTGAFADIHSAINKKIDIVHFDAHNFQCMELLYELRNHVSFVIGSEEKLPDGGTPYDVIMKKITSLLQDQQVMPRKLCFEFVSAWHRHFSSSLKGPARATLSAVNLAEFPMISEKINIFIDDLINDLNEKKHRDVFVNSIVKKVRRYLDGKLIDAFDIGRLCNEEVLEERIEQSSREFLASVTNATVKNSAIGDFSRIPGAYNSFGISVFMPLPVADIKNYDTLEFARETGWKKFLECYYALTLQKN